MSLLKTAKETAVNDYKPVKVKAEPKKYGGLTWEQIKAKRESKKFDANTFLGRLKDQEMVSIEHLISKEKRTANLLSVKSKVTVSDSIYSDVIKQAIFSPRAMAATVATKEVVPVPLSPKNSERQIFFSPISSSKKRKFKLPKIMEIEESPVVSGKKKPLMEPDPEVEV